MDSPPLLQPFDAEAYTRRLLVKAGITEDELAQLIRRAIDETSAELDAMETKFFAHEGVVTDTRQVVAWGVRAKAAERVFDLTGVRPQKQAQTGPVVQVSVVIPDYRQALNEQKVLDALDITPCESPGSRGVGDARSGDPTALPTVALDHDLATIDRSGVGADSLVGAQ